jgi:hypothetical protein
LKIKKSNKINKNIKMEKLRLILETSTLPGLSNISKNQNILIRIFWIVCLLSLNVVSAFYITNTLIGYYNYETITNIDIIHEDLPQFPTISICVDYLPNKTMDKIMLDCKFDYIECSYKDFSYERIDNIILTVQACIRFNSGYNLYNKSIEIKKVSRSNLFSGLQLKLSLDNYITDDFLKKTIFKLRIFVDNSSDYFNILQIYDIDNGLMIPAGINHVQIERAIVKNLPEPFNKCVKQETNDENISRMFNYFKKNNKTYAQKDCMNLCILDYAMKKCNCSVESSSFNFDKCSNDAAILNCFSKYYDNFLNRTISKPPAICERECPLECDSINYILNHNSFYATDKFLEIYKDTTGESKDDLIYLFIYYPNKQYQLVTQIPRMQTFDLVSSVGGILGLFISVSFLTFVELIEILFKIIFYFFNSKKANYNFNKT